MNATVKTRGEHLIEVAPGVSAADGKPSLGATFRNVAAKDGLFQLDGYNSLYDVFQASVKKFPERECLGKRVNGQGPFVWETYKAVDEKITATASAIAHCGVTSHGRAGIYSINCPEWMTVMQACNRMTIYTVPLYDTLGEDAVQYVVNKSETSIIFVSAVNWKKLMKSLPALKDQVHTVVYWGDEKVKEEDATSLGLKVYKYEKFLELGREHPAEAIPPTINDLCTIMFTSGTTGMPKGVMIPHKMVLTCIAGMKGFVSQHPMLSDVDENDVFLSYLPLAHVMDRVGEELQIQVGGRIGYYSGDVTKLVDDIQMLRPTIFIGVPRVFDRIYAGVTDQINKAGGLRKWIFNLGMNRKLKALQRGVPFDKASPFFDRLVFSKVKARLGGRVRIALSGAAPLAPHVEDFLRTALCCFFAQGYGLTESCAASFIASGEQNQVGTVGVPAPTHDYRLESIPEMKYDAMAEPPRGEICIKGPIIFTGYYKEEGMTNEVLDKEGWFHTGDVGEVLPGGGLRIIDRKKQIFKLSQGEYVAVEKVEAAYKRLGLLAQIWVYGNSLESVLVAVVVPEERPFMEAAKKQGISGSFKEAIQNPKTKAFLQNELNAVAKEGGLKGFEMVKGLIVEEEQFSVENNLLTPTFKLKRPQLQERYKSQIDALYADLKKQKK